VSRLALQAGDLLFVECTPDDLLRLRHDLGVALLPDAKLDDAELREEGLVVVEAIVPPTSALVGRTLAEFEFHRRFGAFVLAVRRQRGTLHQKVGRVLLHPADALLVLVSKARMPLLSRSPELVLASAEGRSFHRPRAWWLVLLALPTAVVLAAAGVVDIAVGALVAAVAILAARALTPQQAFRSVDWSVIFLIAAFVPVGQAILDTGAAHLVADGFVGAARLLPEVWVPWAALSLLYLVTSITTAIISNNATAIIVTPVALSLGAELGVDPRPFVVAVCFAASASFMTPMGYQTNLMVHAPGSYRFRDYLRLGAPLNLLAWVLGTLLIPVFWPF
jgi:di/tricarboxylate transporter